MKKIFTGTLLLIITCSVFSQNVTNVASRQVGNNIEITYNLDQEANITIQVSENGYLFANIYKVSGDVGKNVAPGRKKIVWDVLSEMDKLQGDNIVFKIIATESSAALEKKEKQQKKQQKSSNDTKKTSFLIGLNLNFPLSGVYNAGEKYNTKGNSMNYDFYLGYLGNKFGMMLKFKTNFIFGEIGNTNATNIEDFTNGSYTIHNSEVIRMSVIFDFAVRLSNNLFMYAGAGYGYRSQLLNATTHTFSPITGKIEERDKSFYYGRYKSVEFDLGLLIRSKLLTYTGGISCLPFRVGGGKPYFELHVGIGLAF